MSNNVPISPSLTVKLVRNSDGNVVGTKAIRVLAGEEYPVAIDAMEVGGQWIDSANNVSVVDVGTPSGELSAAYLHTRGSDVIISVDAADADAGDEWRVQFDVHPTSEQTIKAEIRVECE